MTDRGLDDPAPSEGRVYRGAGRAGPCPWAEGAAKVWEEDGTAVAVAPTLDEPNVDPTEGVRMKGAARACREEDELRMRGALMVAAAASGLEVTLSAAAEGLALCLTVAAAGAAGAGAAFASVLVLALVP
jgi:hypothetical protein